MRIVYAMVVLQAVMMWGMSVTDNFMNHIKQQVGTSVTSAYFWICVIAVVLVIERILAAVYRDKLRGTDSVGTTIRNVGLIIADLARNPEGRQCQAAIIPRGPGPSFPRRRETTGRATPP